ncbi:class I SAM-dependent methyltransferase [Muricoccus roseus]|nr:class I SAM-dependent methyltransferase [Roseomonas rosea]
MPDALAFRERAEARGASVIGASSIEDDPARGFYPEWEYLPFVTGDGFDTALAGLIRRRGVRSVYTPHFVIHRHLEERLGQIAPGTALAAGRFPQDEERAYRALRERVASLPCIAPPGAARAPLTPLERLGLVRLTGTIPGMCGEEKMLALMEVMRHAPEGDIVEIGSWWGRSAALLVLLARRWGIGPVLCVDPWESAAMPQGNALLDSTSARLDTEEALRIFEINLSPLAGGRLNYLRARSTAACAYAPGLEVTTAAFGTTRYSGRIAVLHIDGNHAHEEVERDIAAWVPRLRPGGWIIFDDYEWAFGDGPRRAADSFVAREAGRIAATFRAGPALLVQLRNHAHD